jgi:hypothetical protein
VSRPRAGHGWVPKQRGVRVSLLFGEVSGLIPTGKAAGWPRCSRCRKPIEASPFESGLCSTCYFHRAELSAEEFWRLHDEGHPLAPYNIGRRFIEATRRLFNEETAP